MKLILSLTFACVMLYGGSKSKQATPEQFALKQSHQKTIDSATPLRLNDGTKNTQSQLCYKLLKTGVEKASKLDGTIVVRRITSPFESQPLLASR